MSDLNEHEIQILREINGDLPPSPWGAWVGVVLSQLRGRGYITSKFNGKLTDKGREALAQLKDHRP